MSTKHYKQLEIWWVDLDPVIGAETRKKRPCIILQQDILNHGSKTVLIAPILPGHKDWPFAVNVKPTQRNGLDKERHINLKQLRVVDLERVSSQQGMLEKSYLPLIHHGLKLVFGIPTKDK
jgi:mRNA interferase MazF